MKRVLIIILMLILLNFLFKSQEGLCIVPKNPAICGKIGATEAVKVQTEGPQIIPGIFGPRYDLKPVRGPFGPAWHDPEIRIPGDFRPFDFGPKVSEKGDYGKEENDTSGDDGHLFDSPGHSKDAHEFVIDE